MQHSLSSSYPENENTLSKNHSLKKCAHVKYFFGKYLKVAFQGGNNMLKIESQSKDVYKTYQQVSVLDRKGVKKYQQLLNPQDYLYQEINRILIVHQSGIHQLSTGQKINATKIQLCGGGIDLENFYKEIDRINKEIEALEQKRKEVLVSYKENEDDEFLAAKYRNQAENIFKKLQEEEERKRNLESQIDNIRKREEKEEEKKVVPALDSPQSQVLNVEAKIKGSSSGGHMVVLANSPGAIVNIGEYIGKLSLKEFGGRLFNAFTSLCSKVIEYVEPLNRPMARIAEIVSHIYIETQYFQTPTFTLELPFRILNALEEDCCRVLAFKSYGLASSIVRTMLKEIRIQSTVLFLNEGARSAVMAYANGGCCTGTKVLLYVAFRYLGPRVWAESVSFGLSKIDDKHSRYKDLAEPWLNMLGGYCTARISPKVYATKEFILYQYPSERKYVEWSSWDSHLNVTLRGDNLSIAIRGELQPPAPETNVEGRYQAEWQLAQSSHMMNENITIIDEHVSVIFRRTWGPCGQKIEVQSVSPELQQKWARYFRVSTAPDNPEITLFLQDAQRKLYEDQPISMLPLHSLPIDPHRLSISENSSIFQPERKEKFFFKLKDTAWVSNDSLLTLQNHILYAEIPGEMETSDGKWLTGTYIVKCPLPETYGVNQSIINLKGSKGREIPMQFIINREQKDLRIEVKRDYKQLGQHFSRYFFPEQQDKNECLFAPVPSQESYHKSVVSIDNLIFRPKGKKFYYELKDASWVSNDSIVTLKRCNLYLEIPGNLEVINIQGLDGTYIINMQFSQIYNPEKPSKLEIESKEGVPAPITFIKKEDRLNPEVTVDPVQLKKYLGIYFYCEEKSDDHSFWLSSPIADNCSVALINNVIFKPGIVGSNFYVFKEKPAGKLRKNYLEQSTFESLVDEEKKLSIEDHYTTLAMITDKEWKEKQEELKNTDARPPTYETIFQPKEPIQLEKIFEREELQKTDQRGVLIKGPEGIGKSTLCMRIVYRWAQGKLWPELKAVIWIRFRNLINYSNRSDLYEVITKECSLKPPITQLLQEEKFRKDCLLILDGYDEIPDEKLEFLIAAKGPFPVLEAFQKEFPRMIVTTRPQSVPGFKTSLKLEILGFENHSISNYVENFFRPNEKDSEEEKKKKTEGKGILQKQLENPLVRSLCHIPINLEIFCSLALLGETFPDDRPLGIAQIYDRLTDWLMRRYFLYKTDMKREDVLAPLPQQRENIANPKKALEELAWKGLDEKRFYFKNTDQDPEISQIFKKYDIDGITDVTKVGPFRISDKEGQFIHPLLQEFFAAKYLTRLLKEEKPDVPRTIAEKKFDPRYQLVFSMTSGLLAQNQTALQDFFNLLDDSPIDLGGSRRLILLAKYFEECGDSAKTMKQYESFIPDAIELLEDPNVSDETKFDLLHKNYSLLAHNETINFFLKKLNSTEFDTVYLLEMLAIEGNSIPKNILTGVGGGGLIALLSNSTVDLFLREKAIEILGITAQAEEALPDGAVGKLIALLKDTSLYSEAAWSLRAIVKARGTIPDTDIEKLITALEGSRVNGREVPEEIASVLEAILQAGGTLPEGAMDKWIDIFTGSQVDLSACEEAACALEAVARAKRTISDTDIEKLITALTGPLVDNVDVSEKIARVLGAVVQAGGTIPDTNIKKLITALTDPLVDNVDVSEKIARVLGAVVQAGGIIPDTNIEKLITALTDPLVDNVDAHKKVAQFLEVVVRSGRTIPDTDIEKLITVLTDSLVGDVVVREEVAWVLEAIVQAGGTIPDTVIYALIDFFASTKVTASAQRRAVKALGAFIQAERIFSEKALESETLPEKAIYAMIGYLGRVFYFTQASASQQTIEVLGTIAQTGGTFSKRALNGLIAVLTNPSTADIQTEVAETLVEISRGGGAHSEEALDALINLLADRQKDTIDARGHAAEALQEAIKIGRTLPKDASAQLMNLLDDLYDSKSANEQAYEQVVGALQEIVQTDGDLPKHVSERLVTLLNDSGLKRTPTFPAGLVGKYVAKLFGKIARAGVALSEGALEGLMSWFQNRKASPTARDTAAQALKEIARAGGFTSEVLDRLVIWNVDSSGLACLSVKEQRVTIALWAIARSNGDRLDQMLEKLISSLADGSASTAESLRQIIKAKKVDLKYIQKILEYVVWVLGNQDPQDLSYVELLEEIVKTQEPSAKNAAMEFLSSVKQKNFSSNPEYIESFLATFLKSFSIQTEDEERLIATICKRRGIAFYKTLDGQYHIASGKKVHSLKLEGE